MTLARRPRRSSRRPPLRIPAIGLVALAVIILLAYAWNSSQAPGIPARTAAISNPATLAALNKLPVSDSFVANYVRDDFGAGWKDPDHNGCDARNDVLARDLTGITFRTGTHNCVVLTGRLADPYTGATIDFVRGNVSSMAVQIDHIVPLGWAWQHGAANWTPAQRVAFSNDPTNLLAVSGAANEAKSDQGPGEWMPANTAYRCTYIQKFEGSLVKYNFSIAKSDLTAIRSYLATCGL